jgi:hypothetical protein
MAFKIFKRKSPVKKTSGVPRPTFPAARLGALQLTFNKYAVEQIKALRKGKDVGLGYDPDTKQVAVFFKPEEDSLTVKLGRGTTKDKEGNTIPADTLFTSARGFLRSIPEIGIDKEGKKGPKGIVYSVEYVKDDDILLLTPVETNAPNEDTEEETEGSEDAEEEETEESEEEDAEEEVTPEPAPTKKTKK